jgi:hypothetical protein
MYNPAKLHARLLYSDPGRVFLLLTRDMRDHYDIVADVYSSSSRVGLEGDDSIGKSGTL